MRNDRQGSARTALALVAATLGVASAGCGAGERGPLPDWSEGFEDPIAQAADPGPVSGPLELVPVDDVGIAMRLTRLGSNDPCALGFDGTIENYRAIECMLDISEADLHFGGLHFALNVPSGACDYVVWNHYMYMNWEVGTPEPPDVSYEKDPVSGAISNEVNSIDGVPTCQYDYTEAGGPNCCLGEYTVTVTDSVSGEVSVSPPKKWGGRAANCFTGAAYFDPDVEITEEGWPAYRYVQLAKEAYFNRFDFDPLADIGRTNVTYANYYNPDDHEGAPPAGLGAKALAAAPVNFEYAFYKFSCVDTAKEHYSDIRLIVREWNTEAEFINNGNPDVEGNEPSGLPNDDFYDWRAATPDSTTFIEEKF